MKTYPVITRIEPAGNITISVYATGSLKTEKPTVYYGRNAAHASSFTQVLSIALPLVIHLAANRNRGHT